jgi:hypothetical protein
VLAIGVSSFIGPNGSQSVRRPLVSVHEQAL